MSLGAFLAVAVPVLAAFATAVLVYYLQARRQDEREDAQREIEWRETWMKVRAEIARNRNVRLRLHERLAGIGPLPRDAHEQLRADAWDEESGRLSQLMPPEDFERLETYYREREQFAEALRDYHRPEHTKTDRPRLRHNLRRLSEGVADAERRVLGNRGG